MEFFIFLLPAAVFVLFAFAFLKVRNDYVPPVPDPPGVRSVVWWAGPDVPEADSSGVPGETEARYLIDGLKTRGFDVGEPAPQGHTWSATVRSAHLEFQVRHGFNGDGPWMTIARPLHVVRMDVETIAAWRAVVLAIHGLLLELDARDLHWIRHEDHVQGDVDYAFDDPVD